MTATVFIINGRARAGKDTLAQYMEQSYQALGYSTYHHSSVSMVKQAMAAMGIDTSRKNQADRTLLASVANAIEEHSQARSKDCVHFVTQVSRLRPQTVVFLMIREPRVIERVRNALIQDGHNVHRVLVEAHRSEIPTNPADAEANTMNRDFLVRNVGSLGDLAREAQSLVNLVQMRREELRAS